MHRFFILVVAGTTASAAAFADDHARLRGTYAFTGMSSCIQDSASLGFNPNFSPKGPVVFFSYTVEGVSVFHGDGTGTVNTRSVAVGGGASSTDSSFQFTYTIGPDGKLSIAAVPGTNKATILTGPRAGQTQVNDVSDVSGFVGEGARTIILGQPAPTIENVTFSNGNQFTRVCNQSRIHIRISNDDR
jgi:hypothetical protein